MSHYSVAISKLEKVNYPTRPPFHPSEVYPEFKEYFKDCEIDESNNIYSSLRESFKMLSYDLERFGKKTWNPLGWLIKPGETVLLNPNLLAHKHLYNDDWDYLITHGSIIRAAVDYVFIALKGQGRIIIADGPQADSVIEKILELTGILEIQIMYKKMFDFDIEFIDFRDTKLINIDGVTGEPIKLKGDPLGSEIINLGNLSMFSELDETEPPYYGSHYDIAQTQIHHTKGIHEYCICKTSLSADVFINIPKLKTHKKCGLTVNLKSLVGGVNADKNYLPHYVIGAPEKGGDQFNKSSLKTSAENALVLRVKRYLAKNNFIVQFISRKLKNTAYKVFGKTSKVVRSGNWYGNDTVWRMCLDLNRILMYCNPDGSIDPKKEKKFISIVDGVYSMEGQGPNAGVRKDTGLLIVGDNPVSVDTVCARIMGFDEKKIKLVYNALNKHLLPLYKGGFQDINIVSNETKWNKLATEISADDSLKFEPHFGWKGHIEL